MIVATFETRKDQYANNIIADQQKYKLYDQYSLEEIEKELNKYNISITQKDIISKYEASYDINNIIKDYQMTYEEQLNNLYDLQILFDHECIMLYVHKTIEENYPVNEIPEYHYVIAALMQFLKLTEDKKLEYFLTLLKTMNKMSDFMVDKKISFIFREIPTDIEAVLETCIAEDIHNCFPDLAMSQALSQEIFLLLENYHFECPEMIYAATLGLLAMHGYPVVEKKFRNGLNLYPNDHIRLYMSILFELVSYYDKHNEDFSLEPLYQEVFQITPHSREDRMNLKSIQENYGYYINKENKQ